MDEGIRLNKYLSEAGFCSRREADRLTDEGRISINGVTVSKGTKVMPDDEVCVDGVLVSQNEPEVVLIYNKPKGVVCSTKEKDNIVDYIGYPVRIYPVGRLDKESEGLILLTNQGDISDAVLRAANKHEKEYHVRVDKPITDGFIKGMENGVPILDTVTRPCKITKLGARTFSIVITQGLNRQIRRMCEYFGYKVTFLKRVRIMNIELGNMRSGQYIEMTAEEIKDFRKQLGVL